MKRESRAGPAAKELLELDRRIGVCQDIITRTREEIQVVGSRVMVRCTSEAGIDEAMLVSEINTMHEKAEYLGATLERLDNYRFAKGLIEGIEERLADADSS